MARAMPCPCRGPRTRVLRINRSRVPCSRAMRSRSSARVDILPKYRGFRVGCQPERRAAPRGGGGHPPPAPLQVPQGSLYPALHRLERRGWIKAEWGASDNNRKAKYYHLTHAGRKQLEAEAHAWARLTRAVALVLDMR